MASVRGLRRRNTRSKKFDASNLRRAMLDRRVWVAYGVVIDPEDGNLHYDLDGEDLLIEVETSPDQLDVTARLGSPFGGPNLGMWAIPPIGAEVMVVMPAGAEDFMPTIVAVLSTGDLPAGVAENVTVLANTKVLVHDGAGGAAPLPTLAEFKGHTHGSGVGPTGVPIDPIPGVGPIVGTVVFEAK